MKIPNQHLIIIPLLLLILGSGCSSGYPYPFELDPDAGSLKWAESEDYSLEFGMELNQSNPLSGAFTFGEKEKVICIGTVGELDMIVELSGDTRLGIIQMRIRNPGKENLELRSVAPVIIQLPLPPGVEIQPGQNPTWELIRVSEKNRLRYCLDLGDSPLVLLPEEEVILPELAIIRK